MDHRISSMGRGEGYLDEREMAIPDSTSCFDVLEHGPSLPILSELDEYQSEQVNIFFNIYFT